MLRLVSRTIHRSASRILFRRLLTKRKEKAVILDYITKQPADSRLDGIAGFVQELIIDLNSDWIAWSDDYEDYHRAKAELTREMERLGDFCGRPVSMFQISS